LLVDMVHLSLQALGGQATAVTQKQALYDRICEHVASHVRDPGLSVDQVAEALNCSRRHLHNAFAGETRSLGGFIQQSRLELCMRELHSRRSRIAPSPKSPWAAVLATARTSAVPSRPMPACRRPSSERLVIDLC
jgi:hypothetical protein